METIEKWYQMFRQWVFTRSKKAAEIQPMKKEVKRMTVAPKREKGQVRMMDMICLLEQFLQERYEFRFNQLTEETEFRRRRGLLPILSRWGSAS